METIGYIIVFGSIIYYGYTLKNLADNILNDFTIHKIN